MARVPPATYHHLPQQPSCAHTPSRQSIYPHTLLWHRLPRLGAFLRPSSVADEYEATDVSESRRRAEPRTNIFVSWDVGAWEYPHTCCRYGSGPHQAGCRDACKD